MIRRSHETGNSRHSRRRPADRRHRPGHRKRHRRRLDGHPDCAHCRPRYPQARYRWTPQVQRTGTIWSILWRPRRSNAQDQQPKPLAFGLNFSPDLLPPKRVRGAPGALYLLNRPALRGWRGSPGHDFVAPTPNRRGEKPILKQIPSIYRKESSASAQPTRDEREPFGFPLIL